MLARSWLYLISLLLTLGILFYPSEVQAQEEAVFRVIVISDDDGNPIPGANVVLLNPENDEILHAGATDNDGFHEFRVPPRQYDLQVSFVGYNTHQETISLQEAERRVDEIILTVNVEQLDEIFVQAERDITTGDAGLLKVTELEINRIPTPGPGGDLASYLQTVPGIVSTGDRGGELHIRGGTPTQNQVLVDNMPIAKPFHISNLFSAFPSEAIQSADIFAGGFGAEYMGATSAVVDVNLRPGNMRQHKSSAAISPYLYSIQAEGPIKTDEQSFLFVGRNSVIEQTAPHITGENVPLNFYDLTARYSLRTNNLTCNITGIRTYDRGQINPTRDLQLSWNNNTIGARCLGYDEMFNHPFELTLGYSTYRNEEATATATERSAGFRESFFKFNFQENLLGLPIDYGGGLTFRFYDAELAERFSSVESFSTVIPIVQFYGSTEWQPWSNLTLEPSFGTQLAMNNHPTAEPRLRILYKPGPSHKISLAVGKYHQMMEGINDERDNGTIFTVWKPIEKDDPAPGSVHGIIGYEHTFNNHLTTNFETYLKNHSNIPVSKWNPEVSLEMETALADGNTYGFDARVEYDRNPFYLLIGYGYSKLNYEAASEALGAWIEEPVFSYSPPHDQRHQLNVTSSLKFAGYTASVNWQYGSGKPYTQVYGFDLALVIPSQHPLTEPGTSRTLFSRPYGERLPDYHRLDISLERLFQLSENLTIETKIGVINSYDRDNIFYYDLHSLQRVDQTPLFPYFSLRTAIN